MVSLVILLQECQALFLVFTVQGSSYFHGLASVNGLAPSNLLSAFGQSNLTTVYFVNWIKRYFITLH